MNSHYTWGAGCEGWHLMQSERMSVIRERMPPGTSEIMHYHLHAQQLFYILSGSAQFDLDGQMLDLGANDSIHVPPKSLHRICNISDTDLFLLLASQPKILGDRIEIIDYEDQYKDNIRTLNYEWLEKYFRVEPGDVKSLSNPQGEILNKNGAIFFARQNEEIVGTASLLHIENDLYELGKMAVTPKAQGRHIGNILIEHCFYAARKLKIKKLVLYSNTSLGPAIHLYEKHGFRKVPMETGHYERANIKMEKVL